jgi:voltage-gated potassium channel
MIFNLGMAILIISNVIAVMLETIPSFYGQWKTFFTGFEYVSVGLFTIEYVARLWVADHTPQFQGAIIGRIKYLVTPMALVDLAAILPSLLLMSAFDLRFLRIVRLFRVVRLLRLPHYNQAMYSLWSALRSKREQLVISVVMLLVLLIISSSLEYFAEHEAQPEVFSSIPAALWWAVTALTTVGYGDIYPITPVGKVIASFVTVLGIGIFALPGGILAAALIENAKRKNLPIHCPHCGKDIGRER